MTATGAAESTGLIRINDFICFAFFIFRFIVFLSLIIRTAQAIFFCFNNSMPF
jgi:hypothetical protein